MEGMSKREMSLIMMYGSITHADRKTLDTF